MIDVHTFAKPGMSDSDVIEAALRCLQPDGVLVIPPRALAHDPARSWWLLDRAILLPSDTTVVLRNCTIKLSDACRDNFFRSANCGPGIADPAPACNIHIRGEGLCRLQGADHPRATGDGSKTLACPCPYLPEDLCRLAAWIPAQRRTPETLDFWDKHDHSYGTDALKAGESQRGDWRGIGVLLANVRHFSLSGLRIENSHGWGISLEACSYGRVERIDFDSCMSRMIDGMLNNMENQDGIDLRNGCHHVTISDITGRTGDDVIALTAIVEEGAPRPGGRFGTTQVMHTDWSRREAGIHDVIIRNVAAYSHLCYTIRVLPGGARIQNVLIDGVIDTPPADHVHGVATLNLGLDDPQYGTRLPKAMSGICVRGLICDSRYAVRVTGALHDSVISDVVCRDPACPALTLEMGGELHNVQLHGLHGPVQGGGSD